jgi:alpha-L-fucosidase
MPEFLQNYPIQSGPFEPTWESLRQYQCPDWFRDAKLGIWSHWGPQCVPMAGDWYARHMYQEDHFHYLDHWRRWGHPSKHGYKDLVDLWKAEKFDPDELMKLYAGAGAKYFFAQAVHHDNFDNWNSAHNKWNSLNHGPQKDIVGLWQAAAKKQRLKFGVSEHLAASFSWWRFNKGTDKTGPYAGVPYDGNDPRYQDLYYPNKAELSNEKVGWLTTDPWFHEHWLKRILDLITKYQPDLLYSDSHLPWDKVGLTAVAHLYNVSAKSNGGMVQAIYQQKDMDRAVASIGVLDVERGQMDEPTPFVWQTDTCVGGWYFDLRQVYKTPAHVLALFVDIVAKNGCLLLNFTQKPDGTLDDENLFILKTMTDWVKVNGEGIYGTRPWLLGGKAIAMEGPTRSKREGFKEDALPWTTADFRFTSKGSMVYAFQMAYPERREAFIRSLGLSSGATAKNVRLLGHAGNIAYRQLEDGLLVQLPPQKVSELIPCIGVELA